MKKVLLVLIFLSLFFGCEKREQKADFIISNATIWTGNNKVPKAQAMAVIKDSIIAIGNLKQVNKFKGRETNIIDLNGAFVTPGFIDSHVHLMMGGNALLNVQLRDVDTKEEFKKRIREAAKNMEPGAWILEGNWDHTLWGGELPNKSWIDDYTKDNPVVIYRMDGHMVLANSLALKIAGINKNTLDVEGGKFLKNENGELTGILKGHAMTDLLNKIPAMTEKQKETALKAAQEYFLSNGVTSLHDVDSLGTYDVAAKLKFNNDLKIRIYTFNPLNRWKELRTNKEDNKWLKDGGLKGFVDGSLGSHTAAFKEDYSDKPNDKGYFINSEENLYKWVLGADKANLQVTVHAIGDKAIHTILNIYERVITENGKKDRRFRIEHAQHIAPEDLGRFAKLGVIASVQPYHAIDDGRWAEEVIGSERIKTTYAFKSLLNSNATICLGSDWPVAPTSPLYGIYAATTRRTLDNENENGWVPEQKISVEEALLGYTKYAAISAFDDKLKGTLEVGKLADFVVISDDITKVDPKKIKDLKILQTYVGGKKVYESK
ncbi:amidohydrolase [uncultured Maribacter sp.]|uniref:amidohydrolase n=1 Tax=uncultured Maribacter sp. TaxID=431308 RepID=UPI002637B324|nr:amidohydrolase [uncultured Maribacter sp.]